MPRGDLLKKLFYSYAHGDDHTFKDVATQIIRDEESKNNRVLANALKRNLSSGPPARSSSGVPGSQRKLAIVPFEREKQLPLVDEVQPERRASDLVLDRSNQQTMQSLLREFRQRETLGSHGLRPRTRLLFCGPPGCGKTLCAEVLAHEAGLPLLTASMDVLVSSLLGETASNLRKIFDHASAQPVVLLLDEFDAIARLRDDESLNGELRRVVNSLLTLIEKYKGQGFVIAATNHEKQLDPAIWRRFDDVVFFEKPRQNEIIRLLNLKLKNFRHEFTSEEVAPFLERFSHADVERACLNSIRNAVLNGRNIVSKREFLRAIILEKRRKKLADTHRR